MWVKKSVEIGTIWKKKKTHFLTECLIESRGKTCQKHTGYAVVEKYN